MGGNVRLAGTPVCKNGRNIGVLSIFGVAALLLSGAYENAGAEEQLRVANAGANKVTAQARINISVTVTRMMLLRLGSVDSTLTWTNVARDSVRCTVGDQSGPSTMNNMGACTARTLVPASANQPAPVPPGALSSQPTAIIYTVAGI